MLDVFGSDSEEEQDDEVMKIKISTPERREMNVMVPTWD